MSGLGTLIRLILRRDRFKLPLLIGCFVVSLLAMIPLLRGIYGDEESLLTVYTTFGANPAGMFMTGPMDAPTFGAFMTLETLLWWGLTIAFINTLLIVRHTRHNEEIGAQELLLSAQVHRSAGLVAALVVALGVNSLIVIGVGLGMELMGAPWAAQQSWLFGLALGGFGFAWSSIAAVVVQLVQSGRSANGALAGLIGLGFIVRGVGDFMGKIDAEGLHQAAWVSNLSPFGWLQATRPLTEPDWFPLLMPAVFTVMAAVVAFALLARRDVGAGVLPSRSGRARASQLRQTPLGLVLYLQKNVFTGWLAAVLVLVVTIGALMPQMGEVYTGSDSMRQMIESIGGAGAILPSFISAMIAIMCLMVFGYVLHGLTRLRAEEVSGHLESLLSTKLTRLKWAGLHTATVLLGGLVMLSAIGIVMALSINALSDFSVDVGEYALAALSYAPVMLAFAGLYLVLFGLIPRLAAGVAWLYFGFVAFALWLGPIVQLDRAIMGLSVMEHIAAPPVETIAWRPLALVALVAFGLIVLGFIALRRRDIG